MKKLKRVLLATSILLISCNISANQESNKQITPLYQWTKAIWNFQSIEEKTKYLSERVYAQAPIHGVEVDHNNNIYVTTPRLLNKAVPATFSKVTVIDGNPVLEPWPNWQTHSLQNRKGLRNVLGGFVDNKNQIWLLDMGFVNGENESPLNSQKLVAYNAKTGKLVDEFIFSSDIANPRTSFLNDLTIDEQNGYIFISDSGNRGGSPTPSGIIVINLKTREVKRHLTSHISVRDDIKNNPLVVNGEAVFPGNPLAIGINGISLSPDNKTLYWSITSGDALYSIESKYLTDFSHNKNSVNNAVNGPYKIGGGSDGIMTIPNGNVLITDITNNRLLSFNPNNKQFSTVLQGDEFIWPDSLASDFNGNILMTTNHLNRAFAGTMNFETSKPNFKIFKLPLTNIENNNLVK